MTKTQEQFFELVKAGMWGTIPDIAMFDNDIDWSSIYHDSRAQALTAIVLDGIQLLPETVRPPLPLYLKWCAEALTVEDDNEKLNKEITTLFGILESEDIQPVLLKGQGLALNYPNPLHRQSGDIDIYIGEANFDRVNRILERDGQEISETSAKHSTYRWHDVDIENHRILTHMAAPKANRMLQRWITTWFGNKDFKHSEIDGTPINTPPIEFEIVYVLHHAAQHLVELGLGLRQVCDWAMLLHRYNGKYDKCKVALQLESLHLSKVARVFEAICVDYLGMPQEDILLAYDRKDQTDSEWVIRDILKSGNFGQWSSARLDKPKGYWRGKWHTFTTVTKRSRQLRNILPVEARWAAIEVILNTLKAQLYKLRN